MRRVPGRRDRNSDDRAWFVDQAVSLGCRLVAEYGAGGGGQERRPQAGLPGRLSGEGGVNAALQSLPAAIAHAVAHRVSGDASVRTLTTGNDITAERLGRFGGHERMVPTRPGPGHRCPVACGQRDTWAFACG